MPHLPGSPSVPADHPLRPRLCLPLHPGAPHEPRRENLRKASPCPLCFQPIVARELRLVQIKIVTPPKVLPMSSRVITSLALSTASLLQQGMP